MRQSKRLTYLLILAGVVGLHQPAVAQEAQERLFGRSWTCDASIFLIETTQVFTPTTWKMETSHPDTVWGDREKSCRKYIENRILTGSIWNHFNLSPAEQDRLCKGGRDRHLGRQHLPPPTRPAGTLQVQVRPKRASESQAVAVQSL